MESENFIEWFCSIFLVHANKLGVFKTVKAEWKRIVEAYLVRNSYSSLSNRQFPAMIKDLIANKGFKAENARSGFENTGIFPLNRSKITPNKTAIDAIFQDVTNDKIENCFSGKSTDSQVSLDKTNKINSKNSMNRLSTKEVLLKELDSIKNAVKQASFGINKSVLSVLRDRLKPRTSSKEKGTIIKRTTNYNTTELSAMAQDEATQAAKKRKLDEKEVRKVIREKKNWTQQFSKNKSLKKKKKKKLLKLKKPRKRSQKYNKTTKMSTSQNIECLPAASSNPYHINRLCISCGSIWDEATSSKWVACEKCSNWSCIPCIISYHETVEFVCKECE